MNGSLDTNVVLRLILGDIPAQTVAAETLLSHSTGQIQIADAVFIEIEYALRKHYGFSTPQIVEVMSALATTPRINCNKQHILQALDIYGKTKGVSYVDIVLSVYAKLSNAEPLYTFDKNLSKKLSNTKLL